MHYFRKLPVANETPFSGISGKEDNLARYTKIFGNFLSGCGFLTEFTEFSVEWFVFPKFHDFVTKISEFFVELKVPRGFTLKAHQMFSVHITPEKIKKRNNQLFSHCISIISTQDRPENHLRVRLPPD